MKRSVVIGLYILLFPLAALSQTLLPYEYIQKEYIWDNPAMNGEDNHSCFDGTYIWFAQSKTNLINTTENYIIRFNPVTENKNVYVLSANEKCALTTQPQAYQAINDDENGCIWVYAAYSGDTGTSLWKFSKSALTELARYDITEIEPSFGGKMCKFTDSSGVSYIYMTTTSGGFGRLKISDGTVEALSLDDSTQPQSYGIQTDGKNLMLVVAPLNDYAFNRVVMIRNDATYTSRTEFKYISAGTYSFNLASGHTIVDISWDGKFLWGNGNTGAAEGYFIKLTPSYTGAYISGFSETAIDALMTHASTQDTIKSTSRWVLQGYEDNVYAAMSSYDKATGIVSFIYPLNFTLSQRAAAVTVLPDGTMYAHGYSECYADRTCRNVVHPTHVVKVTLLQNRLPPGAKIYQGQKFN